MSTSDPAPLVSSTWLHERLGSPDIRIIDASWHFPSTARVGASEFAGAHIPGAVFFDIDEIADTTSQLPHTMPSAEKFSSRVRKLGIGDGTTVVVYDSSGMIGAARVWWMFKIMGHSQVSVLDGGFAKWQAEDRPVSDDVSHHFERHFSARPDWARLKTFTDMMRAVPTGERQIIDARPAGRFLGIDPEPREGLRSGHMPGAVNIPSSALLESDGTLKSPSDLEMLFKNSGVDLQRPVTATCGSGVSACLVLLSLATIGSRDDALYDGSWTEWGGRPDTPVVTNS